MRSYEIFFMIFSAFLGRFSSFYSHDSIPMYILSIKQIKSSGYTKAHIEIIDLFNEFSHITIYTHFSNKYTP